MALTLIWTFLWMISFGIIVGMSQAPDLTENIISRLTCANETKIYTCNSTSTRVQWIAEPFVTTGSPLLISSLSAFGRAEFQGGDVVIEQISRDPDPFVTSLTVNGRVSEEIRVCCINAIEGISSLIEFTYISGASVQSSTCNMVDIVSTNFNDVTATVRVGCQPSVSPEVTHTLNYTGGSIIFDGTEATIVVSCDVGSLELRVCVSNRCGQETCGETETFPVNCSGTFPVNCSGTFPVNCSGTFPVNSPGTDSPTCSCPFVRDVVLGVVFGVVGLCLLVVGVVLIHYGFFKCCKDICCDCYVKCWECNCCCCCKQGEDAKGSTMPLGDVGDSEGKGPTA